MSRSVAAALAVLGQSDPLSATELGRRIRLSQSAAARIVDTLQESGLIERRPGLWREVRLALTRSGRQAARQVLAARGSLLVGLDSHERRQLATLMGCVLTTVYDRVPSVDRICCLCDRRACIAGVSHCPIGARCR